MGGLINGATVKGDLWIIEAGGSTLSCYPVATTAEGPGPRVGHASLLVGNAFIVFGGDTKIDDSDVLDDTLYLLNTGDFTAFDFAARLLTFSSHQAMVSSPAGRTKTSRALRAHPQYSRFQDLHFWRSSRGIFLQ